MSDWEAERQAILEYLEEHPEQRIIKVRHITSEFDVNPQRVGFLLGVWGGGNDGLEDVETPSGFEFEKLGETSRGSNWRVHRIATDGGQDTVGTQHGLIYVYWVACKSSDNTTAAHGRVGCPDCGETMPPFAIAGAVVDDDPAREE